MQAGPEASIRFVVDSFTKVESETRAVFLIYLQGLQAAEIECAPKRCQTGGLVSAASLTSTSCHLVCIPQRTLQNSRQ
jgi:hypothetical protein